MIFFQVEIKENCYYISHIRTVVNAIPPNYLTSGSVWDRFCSVSGGQRFTFVIFTFKSRNVVDSFIRTFAFYVKWTAPTFASPNSIRSGVSIKTEIFTFCFEYLTVL